MTDEKDDKWEMPKPVFRSSTGELPKTLQKTISGYNMPTNMADLDDDAEDDILSVMDQPPEARSAGAGGTNELELEPLTVKQSAEPAPEEIADKAPEPEVTRDVIVEEAKEAAPDPAEEVTEAAPFVAAAAPPVNTPKSPTVSAALKPQEKKSGAGSFILIFLLIAALAGGLVWAIMYYMSHRAGNSPF